MKTADIFIGSVGAYIPETTSIEWAVEKGYYPADEAELHELAGAAIAGDTPACEMALRAAQEAVKRHGADPGDTDLLLYCCTWHQGPDGWLPHSYLQRHLVGGRCAASEIRLGCNSMFSALELATSYLRAEPGRHTALLVAADNYGTPLMDRWRMGPGYVGGDAASAVVLTKKPGFAGLRSVASVTVPEAEELHRGSEPLFPPGVTVRRRMDFATRNEQFRQNSASRSEGTTALIRIQQELLNVIEQVVDEAEITFADITRVAFMNYSREIVDQRCMSALEMPMSKSTWDFGRSIGHCGASDQILSFDHLVMTGQLGPGDHMLMLGTGPGVTVSAAVVKVLQAPSWCN